MHMLLSQQRRCGPACERVEALEPSPSRFDGGCALKAIVYAQLQNNSFRTEYSALTEDISDNVRLLGEELFGVADDACNLWIGSVHSETTMHQDWYENLYAVVTGTKVFTLIAPWQAPFLRKRKYYSGEYCAVSSDGSVKAPRDGD